MRFYINLRFIHTHNWAAWVIFSKFIKTKIICKLKNALKIYFVPLGAVQQAEIIN